MVGRFISVTWLFQGALVMECTELRRRRNHHHHRRRRRRRRRHHHHHHHHHRKSSERKIVQSLEALRPVLYYRNCQLHNVTLS